MKRKMILSMVMLLVLSLPSVASATTTVQSYGSGGHTFSKYWKASETVNYDGATCVLTYGFDTNLIHEDYAYAYTNGAIHRSKIKNGNGSHYGSWKVANEWSEQEVTHKGSSITYSHEWQ